MTLEVLAYMEREFVLLVLGGSESQILNASGQNSGVRRLDSPWWWTGRSARKLIGTPTDPLCKRGKYISVASILRVFDVLKCRVQPKGTLKNQMQTPFESMRFINMSEVQLSPTDFFL